MQMVTDCVQQILSMHCCMVILSHSAALGAVQGVATGICYNWHWVYVVSSTATFLKTCFVLYAKQPTSAAILSMTCKALFKSSIIMGLMSGGVSPVKTILDPCTRNEGTCQMIKVTFNLFTEGLALTVATDL